ncbi:MAG: GMC oxidoreductase, partial [Nitrospinota bacterium]
MIEDMRTFANEDLPEFDICIVGSGPAGLSIAHEFLNGDNRAGPKICIVESGGEKRKSKAQALNTGRIVGDVYAPLQESRRRQVGGTANTWGTELGRGEIGIMYSPLDPIDFKSRKSIHSGWPVPPESLDPFFDRAQSLCGSGPFTYQAGAWETPDAKSLPFTPHRLKGKAYQFGVRSRFTNDLLHKVRTHPNVTLFFNATVQELLPDPAGGAIKEAVIGTFGGSSRKISARVFVLAAGGIENARLLLLSNRKFPAGLGNGHDLVGRFFMDHPIVRSGALVLNPGISLSGLGFYDLREVRGHRAMGSIVFTESLLEAEGLLNISTFLLPRGRLFGSRSAVYSAKQLANAFRPGVKTADLGMHVRRVSINFPDLVLSVLRKLAGIKPPLPGIGRGGWSTCPKAENQFSHIEVQHAVEQTPHPENRLMLDDSRDAFGQPRSRLHWRWRSEDRRRIARAQIILKEEIEKTGIGLLKLENDNGDPQVIGSSKHHHIGTTRMSETPELGVVDQNCRVHGLRNLYA